eukprot:TCONS_00051901-protein
MWTVRLALLFCALHLSSAGYKNKGELIARNYLVDSIETLSPTWYVSFQVQPIHRVAQWSNVIHLTASGKDITSYGDRIPAVFFNRHSTSLHICSAVNNNRNYCFNTQPLPLHRWSTVEITQFQQGHTAVFYKIKINGQVVHKVQNKNVRFFPNVQVYRGNPFYTAAPARIRAFTYKNLPYEHTLTRNTLIKKLKAYYSDFEVSFDIRPFGKVHSWSSILHVTEWDDNSAYGNRIPAVFFRPESNKLTICSAINGNKNYCWSSKTDLPADKFSHVIIKQKLIKNQFMYTIYVNAKQVFKIVNTRPITLYRAKVFLSSPWHPAAKAFVQRVRVTTTTRAGFKLIKGKMTSVIPRVDREWYLSFDIKPENKLIYGWGSIIHLTTGGNHGKVGYRIPGIWFNPNSRRLHICYAINHYHNRCINTHALAANKWTSIQVVQVFDSGLYQFKYIILINNVVKATLINSRPRSFQNVQVWTADPWHHAANALLRNLVFQNIRAYD